MNTTTEDQAPSPSGRRGVRGWVFLLYAACALSVTADLLYEGHPHFEFENWFGIYGWFGFTSCVVMVLVAKLWRYLVSREEGYYDR